MISRDQLEQTLYEAAKANQLRTVRLCIQQGAKGTYRDNDKTAVFLAVQSANLELLDLLLTCKNTDNEDLSQPDTCAVHTPIQLAVETAHASADPALKKICWDMVKLIAKARQASLKNQERYAGALVLACAHDEDEVVDALLAAKAGLNAYTRNDSFTAAHHAVQNNNPSMFRKLLDNGCPPALVGSTSKTPIRLALELKRWECLNEFALSNRGGPTDLEFLLYEAVKANRPDTVRHCLKRGARGSHVSTDGNLAMHVAIMATNIEMVELLLTSDNLAITAENNNQQIALDLAAREANDEKDVKRKALCWAIALKIVQANINGSNRTCGGVAFVRAARDNQEDVIDVLLATGADPTFKFLHGSMLGQLALHLAVQNDNVGLCRKLLANAQMASLVCKPDAKQQTPIELAAKLGYWDCVRVLFEHSPDSLRNGTVLVHAAMNNQYDLVRLIAEKHPAALIFREAGSDSAIEQVAVAAMRATDPVDKAKKWKMVRFIAKMYPDSMHGDNTLSAALYNACVDNNTVTAFVLLQKKATKWTNSTTLYNNLHCAVENNNPVLCALLLLHGVSADGVNTVGETALDLARKTGKWECVDAFMAAREIAPNIDDHKLYLLRQVMSQHQLDEQIQLVILKNMFDDLFQTFGINKYKLQAEKILEHNNAIDQVKNIRKFVDRYMASNARYQTDAGKTLCGDLRDILKTSDEFELKADQAYALIDKHDQLDLYVLQCLHMHNVMAGPDDVEIIAAVNAKDPAKLQALLQQGGNPNASESPKHEAVLHSAVSNDDAGCVALLLRYGADASVLNSHGKTPCQVAVERSVAKLVDVFADECLDEDRTKKYGLSDALLFAVQQQHDVLAVKLVGKAMSINQADSKTGMTALHYAAWNNNISLVRALCGHGADQRLQNKDGKTPCELAAINGAWGCVQDFARRFERPNPQRANGRGFNQALVLAVRHGELGTVRALLRAGADVNFAAGPSAFTVLQNAILLKHIDIVKLLLESGADPELQNNNKESATFLSKQWPEGHAIFCKIDQTISGAINFLCEYNNEAAMFAQVKDVGLFETAKRRVRTVCRSADSNQFVQTLRQTLQSDGTSYQRAQKIKDLVKEFVSAKADQKSYAIDLLRDHGLLDGETPGASASHTSSSSSTSSSSYTRG